ncbi:MAG: 4Fe-4S dicluster domain-containing protein, partial [Oscillospiraceae bacterium]|nr:4Fe-4S dicluster domain-containing protein [Oscillospiraceae bacterium]
MDHFKERSTRHYRQKMLYTKEQLEAIESRCVYEQPARCSAACPLKLDARELVGLIMKGDFTSARALIERVAPFPLILARGCEAPCETACLLNELGEGLSIGALERAALRFGSPKTGRGMLKFKKKKTAAVFGADLFSLVLAAELERKSYPVSFFVEEAEAAEIIARCAPFLNAEEAEEELERLLKLDINIEYSSKLTPEFFEERRASFDLLALSFDFKERLNPLESPDKTTLLCPSSGALSSSGAEQSVLQALFDARRAGVSADRIAQGLPAEGLRGEEGAVETRLYTNLEGVAPSKRAEEGAGYSEKAALEEAVRCIQCKCDECIKSCVYLQKHDKSPRVLTREIYNNVDIIMGDHMMNRAINTCSLCSQCSVSCPYGYDIGKICRDARENMVDTGKMSLAYHEFALLDMLFSNKEAFLSLPQPGFEKCSYVFFPGCQAGAIAPETVYKAYSDLCSRLEGGTALTLGCCGAIAAWAGRRKMFEETAEKLKSELEKLGNPIIIAGCPTCAKTLKGALKLEVVGIWDILNQLGPPEEALRPAKPLALHDSCSARGDSELQAGIRKLAEKLGCEIEESELSGDMSPCCGYGGLVSLVDGEMASKMASSCVPEGSACLSYCMACRDRLAREGIDSVHIMELAYGAPACDAPDISEKRKNRLVLKNRLL